MKAKDFGSHTRLSARPRRRASRHADGPGIGTALLGVVCVIGVFGVLTLLYHVG